MIRISIVISKSISIGECFSCGDASIIIRVHRLAEPGTIRLVTTYSLDPVLSKVIETIVIMIPKRVIIRIDCSCNMSPGGRTVINIGLIKPPERHCSIITISTSKCGRAPRSVIKLLT
jgi:hypothetical protein